MISRLFLVAESKIGKFLPRVVRRHLRSHRQFTLGVDPLEMRNLYRVSKILEFLGESWSSDEILKYAYSTYSELNQDLIPLILSGRQGYFVEFGACDGKIASNTFLLETDYGWHGLLSEPARIWHKNLIANRKSKIDSRAVYKASNLKLNFIETYQPSLSTLQSVEQMDLHTSNRIDKEIYSVDSVSLLDLLCEHQCPKHIEYLSIDTEGSEFEILENFDFNEFSFTFINVEHNFTDSEIRVEMLLTSKGYDRVLREISGGDAWYINSAFNEKFRY